MNFDNLLNLVAPHYCISCGIEGQLLCQNCLFTELEARVSSCFSCNRSTPDFTTCDTCKKRRLLRQVWICADYEGAVKELITGLKFERLRSASKDLANILDAFSPHIQNAIVTHVPTATVRKRRRGYDHAQLIASQFAKTRGVRHFELLKRLNQYSQVGQSKPLRHRQVRGAFRAVNSTTIADSDIILVDDVVSTGATLEECATTLYKAGAKSVTAIVVAKN